MLFAHFIFHNITTATKGINFKKQKKSERRTACVFEIKSNKNANYLLIHIVTNTK